MKPLTNETIIEFRKKFPIIDVFRKYKEGIPLEISVKWVPEGKQEIEAFILSALQAKERAIIKQFMNKNKK